MCSPSVRDAYAVAAAKDLEDDDQNVTLLVGTDDDDDVFFIVAGFARRCSDTHQSTSQFLPVEQPTPGGLKGRGLGAGRAATVCVAVEGFLQLHCLYNRLSEHRLNMRHNL